MRLDNIHRDGASGVEQKRRIAAAGLLLLPLLLLLLLLNDAAPACLASLRIHTMTA